MSLRALGFIIALVAAGLTGAAVQAQPDPLIGVWRYQEHSEPALHGALTLSRTGDTWRAQIAGHTASIGSAGGELRLAFPDQLGELRGRLTARSQVFQGFWIQPAAAFGPPQRYATPIVLRAAGPGRWRGQAEPLASSFTLYLKVFGDTDGALVAAFRNPEFNINGGRTQFLVSRDGDHVHFASRASAGRAPTRLDAEMSGGALRIVWPALNRPIALTPVSGKAADGFFPRPPAAPAYAYRIPAPLADGWTTEAAGRTGLGEAALSRVVQAQIDADPAGPRPPLMHSVLVAHHGKLVLEEYFFGFDRATPHDIRSAGKTFGSVMLGAAMLSDPTLGPDSSIYDVAARLGPFANPDPRKSKITLAQLFTHTSGLACDDNDDNSPGAEETMQHQTAQPNWWKYTLDLPMAHDPGARYAYCSANSNLIGAALTLRTGVWLPEYFDRQIAKPLQFGPYGWNLSADGEGYLGGGAYLRPRDFLKVGQLFLDGGVWHGHRVVSADWVKRSTAPRVEVSPATTGLTPAEFANVYVPARDGYAWHLADLHSNGRTYPAYQATGNGGQILLVVPDADLAVVFTAGNYQQGDIWTRWADQIVAQQIIPALRP